MSPIAEKHLAREFAADAPNMKWVSDVTEFRAANQKFASQEDVDGPGSPRSPSMRRVEASLSRSCGIDSAAGVKIPSVARKMLTSLTFP